MCIRLFVLHPCTGAWEQVVDMLFILFILYKYQITHLYCILTALCKYGACVYLYCKEVSQALASLCVCIIPA